MLRPHIRGLSAIAALPLLFAIAGCTGPRSGYPSLAPRPVEGMSLAEPTRPAPPPAVESATATARYAPIIAQAREDDAVFRHTLDEERGALTRGRGAAAGSEAWTDAQQALSRVETMRGPVVRTLSELDAARNADITHTDSGEALAATNAFEQVRQIDNAEVTALSQAWPPSP
jgi:hypothetical protein